MSEQIILREYQKADRKALEDVIRVTWNYDKFATPKTAKLLAKVYLATCLTNQTYSRVAVINQKPAGLILGKDIEKHRCPISYRIHQIIALAQLLITREGRRILKFYKDVDGLDRELLSQCNKEYKGEVALFALNPEHRGKGIGKKLFECFVAYMKSESIETFYLYTDTSCNFGFYEHQGMIRQQQRKQNINMNGQSASMKFYLYDYQIGENNTEKNNF